MFQIFKRNWFNFTHILETDQIIGVIRFDISHGFFWSKSEHSYHFLYQKACPKGFNDTRYLSGILKFPMFFAGDINATNI